MRKKIISQAIQLFLVWLYLGHPYAAHPDLTDSSITELGSGRIRKLEPQKSKGPALLTLAATFSLVTMNTSPAVKAVTKGSLSQRR